MVKLFRLRLAALGLVGAMGLAACETGTTGGAVYYDSMLWNDYYRGYYRPGYPVRPDPPDRPEEPVNPIEPPVGGPPTVEPPIARPPRPVDPGFSRPPSPSTPIHRPARPSRPSVRR